MTPGLDWRALYADSPGALGKLEYCESAIHALRDTDPQVVDTQIDYDTKAIRVTLQEFFEVVDLGPERSRAAWTATCRRSSGARASGRPARRRRRTTRPRRAMRPASCGGSASS
jgi:hypothetical protein